MKKRIAILGSTGSIGTQALDVIAQHPDRFEVEVLTANNNYKLLEKQARLFAPDTVVIGDETHYLNLKENLSDLPIKVFAGNESISQVVQMDTVPLWRCVCLYSHRYLHQRKRCALAACTGSRGW